MDLSKEHDRKGLVATIFIHSIIFLLLLIWTMGQAEEMTEPAGGVEVSFGTPDAGGPEEISQVSETTPQPSSPSNPTPTTSDEEPVVTNNDSEAPVVEQTTQKTTQTKPTESTEKTNESQTQDQPTISEAERAMAEWRKRKNSGTTTNSGDGQKKGPLGQPDARNPGSGTTSGTDGLLNWSLSGFGLKSAPSIVNNSQDDGKVTIQVCLDRRGKIQNMRFLGNRSTTTSSYLITLSKNSIKKMEFSPIGEQSESNCGTISFNYSLQ
ncbi:MAG: hypothetical protein JJ975_12290 [Bacteroidia bacterium]|nr:hypothetical protein [Bacteroidia bacterium]